MSQQSFEIQFKETVLRNIAVLVLLLGLFVPPTIAADGYKVTKKIPIPGQGGWDYLTVDESARRLYVSHGTRVDVLDVDSSEILGSIPTTGVHGIAVASELGRGFISDGKLDLLAYRVFHSGQISAKEGTPIQLGAKNVGAIEQGGAQRSGAEVGGGQITAAQI